MTKESDRLKRGSLIQFYDATERASCLRRSVTMDDPKPKYSTIVCRWFAAPLSRGFDRFESHARFVIIISRADLA